MAAYEIYQRTVGGMRGDVIDKFTRFTASLAFNDVGKWQLDGASTSGCPLSENDGIIIYRDGDPFLSGYVTDISEEVDETFEGGQIVSWTVQGNDDNGLLTRRILFPDPVELDITTQAYHTIRDYAGNTILKYIDYHAGEHAASGRRIPNFTIDSYKDLGTVKTWNARFDVLWDFVVNIAATDNLGINVVWDDTLGKYVAFVYRPQDKSDLIIFSREYGNIKKWAHTRSAPKANAIWVAGQGEETERMISYQEDADSIAKWGRYEGFKDRRDISNEQDENDPRTPQEVLDDIAEALIPENKETDTYELELTPIDRMSYIDDWNLGDIVKIRLGATEFNSIINAISIDYQGGVETITPSVGTIDRGTAGKTYSTIQSISDRVEVLEKNEGGGALNNAGAHNSIYRGISLGTSVSAAQYSAIAAGTFENMYIGDYWTINSVVWRIAAFDYYLTTGDTACNTHHVVIVPDSNLYGHVMNDTNITTGGYVGSKMYKQGLADAKTAINNAFGSAHILSHRQYLCNAVTNGYPSGGSWYDSKVELMTEQSVYGGKVMSPMGNGATIVANHTVDKSQYPLFALNPHMISNRQYFWLRDVVSAVHFAGVLSNGYASYHDASIVLGVRPAFSIIG